jgi:hypothetical protein
MGAETVDASLDDDLASLERLAVRRNYLEGKLAEVDAQRALVLGRLRAHLRRAPAADDLPGTAAVPAQAQPDVGQGRQRCCRPSGRGIAPRTWTIW